MRLTKVLVLSTAAVAALLFLYWAPWRAAVPTLQQPIYHGDEASNRVALTVNVDWGEEFVPRMLETFRKEEVRVTFFVTGRWADKFPDLVRQMADAGHEIGNHGFGHPHPDHLSVALNRRDIDRAAGVIEQIIGRRTNLYAPPYGERGPAVLEAAESSGHRTILWSVDTLDWKLRDADAICTRVLNRIHPGAIVLMHPLEATAAALPTIISELKEDGYHLVTVSQLLAVEEPETRSQPTFPARSP